MKDYGNRFGEFDADGNVKWSAARQGTIVGMLSIGSLIGALCCGKLADYFGRRLTISMTAFFACIGTIIEISSSTHWVQFAIGRLVTGLSVGSFSICVPMYQGEIAPAKTRTVIGASWQLLITFGILLAEIVNFGTQKSLDDNTNGAAWRIVDGLTFAWALVLGVAILFFPESPRYAYSHGREAEARTTIAKLAGLSEDSPLVVRQMHDIKTKLDEEASQMSSFSFMEIFTGPRMMYRTVLACVLAAGQQLTGVNYFFYFGVDIFKSTGISNSYITQLILGAVNFVATVGALYLVNRWGRRKMLISCAAWMCMCFFVFAFVGHFKLDRVNPTATPEAGKVMIAFACLAIVAFAVSWGPLVWGYNAEIFPLRYKGTALAVATAFNWIFNFLISFFTRFITDEIDYYYGLVFAVCCGALVFIVFFFMVETKDRTLEEIDTMFVTKVNPIHSESWTGVGYAKEEPRGSVAATSMATSEEQA